MKSNLKIFTFGCKVNQYESSFLEKKFLKYLERKILKKLIIINTCAVTQNTINKQINFIKKISGENKELKIIICGCFAKVYFEKIQKLDKNLNFYLVWPGNINEDLVLKIKSLLKIKNKEEREPFFVSTKKARYFIKIQDGCEQFCSYCIIPYARPVLKSRDKLEIIEEIKNAIMNGFEEIVLSGIHLGQYGKDKKYETNLYSLLKDILKIKNLGRIRLSSIEITEIDENLIELIRKNKKIVNHLHLPLQSGSDKILALMNRPYNSDFFYKTILEIKKIIPDIVFTTDVIVGFPGEDEEDFENTYLMIEKINFSRLHVFPFSAHRKTKAYNMKDHVSLGTKKERSKILRKLGKKLEESFIKNFFGKELEVVIERQLDKNKFVGKSEYYFDVNFSRENVISDDGNFLNKIGVRKIVKVKF